MAIRPVYIGIEEFPYFKKVGIEFQYYPGFSLKQKQKTFLSLHKSFLKRYPTRKVLEISTKSNNNLGIMLSAFTMMIRTKKRRYSVECAFQSSKVFENGGPYIDLLYKSSIEAKKDFRLKNSGKLKLFNYLGREFPLEPKDYFYNWLYINALSFYNQLIKKMLNYDSFTDIEFNPDKSLNCQAKAAAIFVGLTKASKMNYVLESRDNFLQTIYGDYAGEQTLDL